MVFINEILVFVHDVKLWSRTETLNNTALNHDISLLFVRFLRLSHEYDVNGPRYLKLCYRKTELIRFWVQTLWNEMIGLELEFDPIYNRRNA